MLNVIRTNIDADIFSVFLPQMLEYKKEKPASGIVLIVPDSLSHMAERRMAEAFGGSLEGDNETLTFHQMIRRFLPPVSKRLTDTGKRMLLYRAAERAEISDGLYASLMKKPGFLDMVSDLISEFKRYGVTPEKLKDISESSDNNALKSKLQAISSVFSEYNSLFLTEGFSDSDDDLVRVSQVLSMCDYFSDKAVWIAGFDEILPANLKVIDTILKQSPLVTAIFAKSKNDKSELFECTEKTVDKLIGLCRNSGISFEYNNSTYEVNKSPELKFLTDNFENSNVYTDFLEHISVFERSDIYSEADETAISIADIVLEKGYRYADIGVVVSDAEAYLPFIEAVFNEYNIPFFSDYEISVAEHPASMLLTSVADMIRDGRSTSSVLSFLRTGFSGLSDSEIDLIENHALKANIRGNMWTDEKYWHTTRGMFDDIIKEKEETPVLDFYKNAEGLFIKIENYCKGASKKAKVSDISKALFRFFDDIGVYGIISDKANDLLFKNPNEALRFEQVWNLLTELFEQAVSVIGDEVMSFDELFMYIRNGLLESKMDIIPAGIDRVTVGTLTSFSMDKVKVLYILGANSGKFPASGSDDGLLTDSDREYLNECDTELAPYGVSKTSYDEFRMYKLLSMPSDYLNISYSVSDTSGNKLIPSVFITTLEMMFQNLKVTTEKREGLLISTPEVTLKELLTYKDTDNPLYKKVYDWFLKQDKWQPKLSLIETARLTDSYRPKIEPDNAEILYKNYTSYSVSRLENFYICPFRYFLENGLKAKEREISKIKKSDLGSLLHWAVQKYCMSVDGDATPEAKHKNWVDLTEEKSRDIIASIISDAEGQLGDLSVKTKNILNKVQALLQRCVPMINLSFKNSGYISYGYEWNFDKLIIEDNERSVSVHGIIDRLDIMNSGDTAYIRVIDYKSGVKSFSDTGIYNKLDLQLGVYAIAAEDAYLRGIIGEGDRYPEVNGIFYDKLTDNYEKSSMTDVINSGNVTTEKLDGVVFSEPVNVKGKDTYPPEVFNGIDKFSEDGEASYTKIVLNTARTDINRRSSSVASSFDMESMKKYVKKTVLDADRDIKSGVIDVLPYKKSEAETGCSKYCPYKDVCSYEMQKNEQYRKLYKGKNGFEMMREE